MYPGRCPVAHSACELTAGQDPPHCPARLEMRLRSRFSGGVALPTGCGAFSLGWDGAAGSRDVGGFSRWSVEEGATASSDPPKCQGSKAAASPAAMPVSTKCSHFTVSTEGETASTVGEAGSADLKCIPESRRSRRGCNGWLGKLLCAPCCELDPSRNFPDERNTKDERRPTAVKVGSMKAIPARMACFLAVGIGGEGNGTDLAENMGNR
eukprot:CAMPEP_0180274384 /NCGR_PEP_ID=MMETSP0988-20121125/5296_1 /TAXON_ID=697907 /ORGANISM="non described non described, Strain CCMP2293" /LENGTH=209 /DNA_ID=CAMNT_0022245611 /DNA_START=137 /DNA_END=762 /DNA_ORIENTATION=+